MRKISVFPAILLLLGLAFHGFAPGVVSADGTEILGPPGIPIATGTGIVAAGTGMYAQPGTIDLDVPAGATVEQVLLYWSGFALDDEVGDPEVGDPVIKVNSTDVTGTLIGGPRPDVSLSGQVFNEVTYRADITGLGLVGAGLTSLTVDELDFVGGQANGAGVLVIFDDSSDAAHIDLRDGLDGAYAPDPPPLDTTVPQTFTFGPAASARTATLALFFTSVSGTGSGGGFRPSAIEITSGGIVDVRDNLLDSLDGEEWDTLVLSVVVPAGATSLTVQALSVDNLGIGGNPASLNWITAGLSVPPLQPCIDIEKLVSVDGGETFQDADDCAEAPTTDWSAEYMLVVHNCGDEDLENVVVNDGDLGITNYMVGDLAVDASIELDSGDIPELFFEGLCDEYAQFENTAMATGTGVTSQAVVMDDDPACVICEETGDEGCTPGYWKGEHHFDSWPSGYLPTDLFSVVFGEVITIRWSTTGRPQPTTDPTLLQALEANGGGINELARHAVAGLLSAAHPDVAYPYTVDEVKALFDNGDAGSLVEANELGCPLNNSPEEVEPTIVEEEQGGQAQRYARLRLFLLWFFGYLGGAR
jgi:hypothetical protein